MHLDIFLYIYIYIYINRYVSIYIYKFIYIYIYACVCIYVFVYVHIRIDIENANLGINRCCCFFLVSRKYNILNEIMEVAFLFTYLFIHLLFVSYSLFIKNCI